MPIFNTASYITEASSDKDDKLPGYRKIDKKLDLLDQKVNSLYKDIYISRPDNRVDLDNVIDRIDNTIDKLNKNNINASSMSELIRRANVNNDMTNTKKMMDSVTSLFQDENLINSLFMNSTIHNFIKARNNQYDLICRYLPRLIDALEIKRDLVLSADNFSKNFINPKSVKSSKLESDIFISNCKKIEEEYDFSNFIIKTYMNVSKYGEDFIYIVPYNIAFERLLKRAQYRQANPRLGQFSFYESAKGKIQSNRPIQTIVESGYTKSSEFKALIESASNLGIDTSDFNNDFGGFKVNLHFNETGIISEAVNERAVLTKEQLKYMQTSMAYMHENSIDESEKSLHHTFDKLKHANDGLSATISDGLITPNFADKDPNKIDDNFIGAVVERIKPENIVPVYIGKKCVGYYYLEFAEDISACGFCGGQHSQMPGMPSGSQLGYKMSEDQQELAIRFISAKISAAIDTKFINANKDLKEEIYAVLRYNEQFDVSRSNDIGVTFIPAEDIIHCYSELDEDTHRGISDLQRALIPAMLYILLYLTDIIGKITRSTDKRVYYVKQNVETNVARTMMNVVAQIKKGNMGMRQLESMNNILNIVGKYNDYIIPIGPSGDPPIQFDTLQGQDINTPTDLMDKMEEAAVNTIMPMELVNATFNQDFATSYSMSNSRIARSVFTRQAITQKWISKIFTKVYNYEFDENYYYIEVILPPPVYLLINSSQQLFDNISSMADKIIDIHSIIGDDNEDKDAINKEFKNLYLRNVLGTYLGYNDYDRLFETAKVNIESRKKNATEDGDNSDMYSGDDEEFQ
jgi:hypothetical protein